ncbi:MAG: LysM peptidoglycan-binding domain-containing protein [Bacteroidota bacterium]
MPTQSDLISTVKKVDGIFEINSTRKSLAFSKVARVGKVSLFILSTHWCKPCYYLKDDLKALIREGKIDQNYVDIYYCMLTENTSQSLESLNMKGAYRNYKYVDLLTESFPTTYILTPTTNCYAIVKGHRTEEIYKHIGNLVRASKEYFNADYLEFRSVQNMNLVETPLRLVEKNPTPAPGRFEKQQETYIVKKNDSVYGIAKKIKPRGFKIDQVMQDIIDLNQIKENLIHPGDVIKLPIY